MENNKMKILAYGGRDIRGFAGQGLVCHFTVVNHYTDSIDVLTTDSTESSRAIYAKHGVKVENIINDFCQQYNDTFHKYKNWIDVYNDLDVSGLKDYDLLYIVGGLCNPSNGLTVNGKQKGKFPDVGGVGFRSLGRKVVNILAMLKAHKLYDIPLHEFAYDPDELNYNGFHEDFALTVGNNYYLYHGYDMPKHDFFRLDSIQSSIEDSEVGRYDGIEKEHNFAFAYTFKRDLRKIGTDDLEKFLKTVPDAIVHKRELMPVDKTTKTKSLSKEAYAELLLKTRFTYILPAYWEEFISVFRILEALSVNCLPIISKYAVTDDINKSFGVDLDVLKLEHLPSEEFRLEQLALLKEKMLFTDRHYFKGQEHRIIKSNDSDLEW